MGAGPSFKVGPQDVAGMLPFLLDAARQGSKKYIVDGKKFAPFGMVPHQVQPEKVSSFEASVAALKLLWEYERRCPTAHQTCSDITKRRVIRRVRICWYLGRHKLNI
ncbi:hypothetical protein AK812_SmicGene31407 [Symbiodinium microadriaticum]|uniref:Uncharacterized protein n=1 Tax=Symbiodinium microadriaticum TaxID=2951 RepID=A0A1Q9CWT3_SYMMI|nr:hypothetical protein AK812_SmicGene31407 [Symbiodinium microadriaticum]